jgi:hypothetical protein
MRSLIFYAQFSIAMMRAKHRLERNKVAYGFRPGKFGVAEAIQVTVDNATLWQLLRCGCPDAMKRLLLFVAFRMHTLRAIHTGIKVMTKPRALAGGIALRLPRGPNGRMPDWVQDYIRERGVRE